MPRRVPLGQESRKRISLCLDRGHLCRESRLNRSDAILQCGKNPLQELVDVLELTLLVEDIDEYRLQLVPIGQLSGLGA